MSQLIYPAQHLRRFLDAVGNGTGQKDLAILHESPTDFYIQPPAGVNYILHDLTILIQDSGKMYASLYGALAALTTGLTVWIKNVSSGATLFDLTDGIPIKTNAAWIAMSDGVGIIDDAANSGVIHLRVDFHNAIYITSKEKFGVTVDADLSGLESHYLIVHGMASSGSSMDAGIEPTDT